MKTHQGSRLMDIYHFFTRWYPGQFRSGYLDEMEEVFQQRLDQAAKGGSLKAFLTLLSELFDLPGIVMRAKRTGSYAGGGAEMHPEHEIAPQNHDSILPARPSRPPAWAVIIGLIPFLISPVVTILLQVFKPAASGLGQLSMSQLGNWLGILFLALLLAVMVILIISWTKGFPAWSFPYWGFLLTWTLLISMAATPGISLFGIPLFGREIWGVRAWAPLILVLAVGIALTRSLRPIQDLMLTFRRDWTSLSYALYIPLPFILWILFDETHGEELFVALMQLILGAGALVYLLSSNPRRRIAALLAGLALSWLPSGIFLWNYWDGRVVEYLPEPIDGSGNLTGMAINMLLLAVILSSPGILKRLFQRSQPGGGGNSPPAAG